MVQNQIQQDLGYSFGELPFTFPLATKKLSIFQWQPLIYNCGKNFFLDNKEIILYWESTIS